VCRTVGAMKSWAEQEAGVLVKEFVKWGGGRSAFGRDPKQLKRTCTINRANEEFVVFGATSIIQQKVKTGVDWVRSVSALCVRGHVLYRSHEGG